MMKQKEVIRLLFLNLLLLALVACGGQTPQLPSINAPDNLAEQAAVASTRAAEAAATAAVVASTVVAPDGNAVATAQAASAQLTNSVDVNSLREKLAAVQPDAAGNITVTITDFELTQAIQAQQAAAAQSGVAAPIQNPQVTFTGGNITLAGLITDPITSQLAVAFRPFVNNGVLQFEVVSASIGAIQVPPALLASAETMLNSSLGEAMANLPAGVVLREITMGEGTMTVMGNQG